MEIKHNLQRKLNSSFNQLAKAKLEQLLEDNRISIMNYLEKNCLAIFKNKITEVYAINDRTNVIDLPQFLETVKIIHDGKWGFSLMINEQDLNFYTKDHEPIYKLTENQWKDSSIFVQSLEEYWQLPINGHREDEYYIQQSLLEIDKFIETDFMAYVKKIIKGGK